MHKQYRTLPNHPPYHQSDVLTLASLAWLATGLVLLCLTPLPAHDAAHGWSPAFWLIVAPAVVLAMLHPRAVLAPAKNWRRARSSRGTRR
ncbi:MAG: hypothetical protein ABI132_04895 [Rhodanobacteraceae bacterium]